MSEPMSGAAWPPPAPTTAPVAPMPQGPVPGGPEQRTVAFRLSWVPAEGDFLEAVRAIRTAQGWGGIAVLMALAASPVVVGLAQHDGAFVVLGVAISLFVGYLLGPGRVRAIRKQWRTSPAWHGERWLEVSPETGITEWSAGAVDARAWWRYAQVLETPSTFVLVLSGVANKPVQIVAKRGLPPGVDPAALGHFLRGWIGGARP